MEIKVVSNILKANDQIASLNREIFKKYGLTVINLLSSPGAGKTTLLEKTLANMKDELKFGVIEGDVQTSRDAERIKAYDVPVIQINTGGGCHLDANMIKTALPEINLNRIQILFIENVGNLICPATVDLGQDYNVVILSTTEGDDKPIKYPAIFRKAHLLIINKIDLLPYIDFRVETAKQFALQINPDLEIIEVSCRTGQGLTLWFNWLKGLITKGN